MPKTRKQLVKEWPTVDRGDGRVEIVCPHNVGHPVKSLSHNWEEWMYVHGCCGCCNLAAFHLAEMVHLGRIK